MVWRFHYEKHRKYRRNHKSNYWPGLAEYVAGDRWESEIFRVYRTNPLLTAAVGFCPLYTLFGVKTNKNEIKKGM
jgi:hypothetical protein